eukprot:8139-Heterococcus_DN1.PRE.2
MLQQNACVMKQRQGQSCSQLQTLVSASTVNGNFVRPVVGTTQHRVYTVNNNQRLAITHAQ